MEEFEIEKTAEEPKQPIDLAVDEINTWLDHKRVPAERRKGLKDNIERLAQFIVDGIVSLDPKTFVFTQKLLFPISEVQTLTYKPRLTQMEISKRTQGLKPTDGGGYVRAYISALTAKPADLIGALDIEDYSFGQALSVFFTG